MKKSTNQESVSTYKQNATIIIKLAKFKKNFTRKKHFLGLALDKLLLTYKAYFIFSYSQNLKNLPHT